jgi:AraC-like DNA-binding protein
MSAQAYTQTAKYWHAAEYANLELLYATFITHRFVPHFHETYVIGVVLRGTYRYFHRGAMRFMYPGEIALINPGEVHTGESVDADGWTYRVLYPAETLINQIAAEMTDDPHARVYFPESVVHDVTTSQLLITTHQKLEHSTIQLERDTLMRQAIGTVLQRHGRQKVGVAEFNHAPQMISRALDYLHAHYDRNVTLDELAQLAGLSPFHFVRVFKAQTGLPPHHYLVQIRLMRAKKLLRQSVDIAAVAAMTGFSDQSHLTRWFKKVMGVPPGQFLATGYAR